MLDMPRFQNFGGRLMKRLEREAYSRSLNFIAAAIRGAVAMEIEMSKIKNFAYTIPTVGRITIGEKVEHNGQKLPHKLNHFKITGHHQRDGRFVEHPAHAVVSAQTGQDKDKVTWIPIKLMFNDPELSVRERYEAFSPDGRMLCAGDGETARRKQGTEIEQVPCAGADHCAYAKAARCKLITRLNVQLNVPAGDTYTADPLSTFILRSSGFNTARTIHAKLTSLAAMLGGHLTGVPLELRLRQKSSAASYQSIFYYVDIVPATDLISCAQLAKKHADDMLNAGLDQAAFEAAVKAGLANGPFEDTSEDFLEAAEYLELTNDGEDDGDDSDIAAARDSDRQTATPQRERKTHEIVPVTTGSFQQDPLAWMSAVRQDIGATENLPH